MMERSGNFIIPNLSFPRRRESRKMFMFGSAPALGQGMDARMARA
jgi:hypothetical protein